MSAKRAEDIAFISEAKERLVALEFFVRTPGWAMCKRLFEANAEAAYAAMMDSKNPHDMAKHLGAHYAMRSFVTWPEREIAALRSQLSSG